MTRQSDYLLQILENIGTPLMLAILQARAAAGFRPAGEEADLQQDAQRMAELLAKTVQTGMDIGDALELAAAGQSDSLRVALTALGSRFIGAHYGAAAKMPSDSDLKKIAAAMQAVAAFAGNFKLDDETIQRLKALRATQTPQDAAQVQIQYIEALLPVVSAVNAFPFGQAEQKLIVDISSRLIAQAKALRQSLFADAAADDHKRCELALLSLLAQIYAACHEAETKHVMSIKADERPALTLNPVWNSFEARVAMMEALALHIAGKDKGAGGSQSPAPAKAPAAPPPPAGGNPMSLFAKKPAAESPPPPLPDAPDAAPDVPPGEAGKNPMSFFKPGAKKDDAA